MKKFLLLSFSILALAGSTFAGSEEPETLLNHQISKIISSELSKPDFILKNDRKTGVVLRVRITSEGGFNILETNSNDQKIKNYTVNKLSEIHDSSLIAYAGEEVILRLFY